jgi:hypothetical protein
MDYEALARQFGAQPAAGDDDLKQLAMRHYGAKPADEPLTPMQGAGAVASGFNRSILSGIPGLPVKTALDVADLGRAAYGYAGNKLGFLSPDQLPPPLNRSQFVGSPEWIAERIGSNPIGAAAINNPRPDNPAARVLNAGGGALGAGMTLSPGPAAMQFASGVSGQAASELGAPPEWSLLASMGPQAAITGGAAATRGTMRGGEQGRAEMESRLQDFNRAGVDPTVGLATGNRRTQAFESLLSKVPGGAGPMAAKVGAMGEQMQNAATSVRDLLSPTYGPIAAGEALRGGIGGYRQNQQNLYGQMQDRALAAIPPGMTFPVTSMMARGGATLADIPNAPNVTRALNAPLGLTQDVLGALQKDAAPRPPGSMPSPVLQSSGLPFITPTPGAPGGLPFEGIQGLKQRIGQIAYASNPLMADANQGALKSLYGGAKQDLQNAGALADAQRVAQGQQPAVLSQLTRADRFYTQTQSILENVLAPIYKAGETGPEKSFYRVEGDLRNSGQQVTRTMASLPLDVRRQVSATAIDRLGRAAPGQQNAEGTQFSPQTFLTNWNRITPEAKNGLFLGIPNASAVRGKLDALANSASMMRDASKVYANPSGTAPAATMLGAGAGLASGALGMATGNASAGAYTMGTILSSMAAANYGARLMTNPQFVTWLSQSTSLRPDQLQAHINRLAVGSMHERDPEQRNALAGFAIELGHDLGLAGR